MSDTHDCPHPRCSRQVGRSHFACRTHWFQLPKDLRDAVWAGYRSDDLLEHAQAMNDAKRWYREAAS